jgi:hypothetical protein
MVAGAGRRSPSARWAPWPCWPAAPAWSRRGCCPVGSAWPGRWAPALAQTLAAGALLVAETAPERFAAVVATSPAISVSPPSDAVAGLGRLRGLAVRVDCGASDPFADAVRALPGRLQPGAEVHVAHGCHNGVFWQRQAPAQLRFLAAALAR